MRSTVFSGNRTLTVQSLAEMTSLLLERPSVTLLPAFSEAERREAEAVVALLLERGCVEFCCVGPEAELLHDAIDELLEKRDDPNVVTTWHTSHADATEYLVLAAGGRSRTLLALVDSHPELVALLYEEVRSACT